MKKRFENLLSPLKIGKVEIKNRFCMGPMGIMTMFDSNGAFSRQGIDYYEERARGGFGLIFPGVVMSDMEIDVFKGAGFPSPLQNPVKFVDAGKELNDRLRAYGTEMFPQVTMGLGRNAEGMHSPSAIPLFADPTRNAKALTRDEVKRKINFMVESAGVLKASGFLGMEVHAMHWGYLLDQFALSLMNHREDEYGGSLENRMRVAKEIVEGVKGVCGADFAVTMRFSVKTYLKGYNQASLFGEEEAGRTIEEAIQIAQMLEAYGYDALSADGGLYDSFYHAAPPMYMKKGHLIDLYAQVKQATTIPLLGGSRMNDAFMAEKAIKEGKIDGVVLARQSLADPYYPRKIAMGMPEKIRPCIACNEACLGNMFLGKPVSCAVNPATALSLSFGIDKALVSKKVAVIGGGVAGMEFARVAKLRGHDVSLYEKTSQLGGNLIPGGQHDFKIEMNELNEWYQLELKDLDVDVQMNTEMNAETIEALEADVVALALGSRPIMPGVVGIDHPKVLSSIEISNHEKSIGDKVVVVGGGLIGCEIAYDYAREGKQVTIIEALSHILSAGEPVPVMNMMMIYDLLSYYKVQVMTGHRLDSVTDDGVTAINLSGDNEKATIPADTVIIAVGYQPLPSMADTLKEKGMEIYQIGDGRKVGNVSTSIKDAYVTARLI